jgi:putative addiction module component (TIGR02574 family)
MTFAAIKKLALQLPLRDRMKLANAMWDSLPPRREPVTLAELERRADEVESGRVKTISSEEFHKRMERLKKSLLGKRSKKLTCARK